MKKIFLLFVLVSSFSVISAQSTEQIFEDITKAENGSKKLVKYLNKIATSSSMERSLYAERTLEEAAENYDTVRRAHKNAQEYMEKKKGIINFNGNDIQKQLYYAYEACSYIAYQANKFLNANNNKLRKYHSNMWSGLKDFKKALKNAKSDLFDIVGLETAIDMKDEMAREREAMKKNIAIYHKIYDDYNNNGKISNPKNVNIKSVKIGEQVWQTENLNISYFRNGDPIYYAKTKDEWIKAGKEEKPAWCYFEFNERNKDRGKYYNGYVILDSRGISDKNWRIPSRSDWEKLANYMYKINGTKDYDEKLKSKSMWGQYQTQVNETNETGFNALPTGTLSYDGELLGSNVANFASWWSADKVKRNKYAKNYLFSTRLAFVHEGLNPHFASSKRNGLCIRLIKN